jgi:hypothetical protein
MDLLNANNLWNILNSDWFSIHDPGEHAFVEVYVYTCRVLGRGTILDFCNFVFFCILK